MLEGKNITLRPLKIEDIQYFHQWRNNIQIKELAMLHPFPVTNEQEIEWYNSIANKKDNKIIFFTIVDKNNNVLGYTQLLNINWVNRNCYFGIIIGDTENRGKGIGKEVTELMTDYAFKTLNLRKILLEVLSTNTNAIKLYENLGFVSEGVLKEHAFIKGVYHDVLVMAKIEEKYE